MQLKSKYSYSSMMNMTSEELRIVLKELREIIEQYIQEQLLHQEAQNAETQVSSETINIFMNSCDQVILKLNKLGHKLLPFDCDMDVNFEESSLTWATSGNDNPKGLDLTFFPKRTVLTWCLGSYG